MSLLDTLRLGVSIANTVTRPLQCEVTLQHYTGGDEYDPTAFTSATTLKAIVESKKVRLNTAAGVVTVFKPTVLFLEPTELAAATNQEGVHPRDKIVLPDGTTGDITVLGGFMDAGTARSLATEVMLG